MRIEGDCPAPCRACSHRHLDEESSLAQKEAWLAVRLSRWADRLEPIDAPRGDSRWGYRDKATLRAGWDQNGG